MRAIEVITRYTPTNEPIVEIRWRFGTKTEQTQTFDELQQIRNLIEGAMTRMIVYNQGFEEIRS